ncbi:glycosyltransferase [Acetobacterium malicum]|uniref:Glycosyltransferase n=1 Tax=Acetobacterium malicum TaxID=52692 RepID=A0ABR6YU28_9FIRM|nr:glycosyltransferase family 4 protein [Acetobacterium malicum]MBC3898673.1 glycosyltransferase [Acetobacterium malicum]
MKILYVTNGDDQYGAASSLKELIQLEKEKEDIEIEVLNPKNNKLNQWCDSNEIINYSFKFYESLYSKQVSWIKYLPKYLIKCVLYHVFNYIQIIRVEKTIDFKTIDIIHSNTSTINFGAILAKRNHIRHIWQLREFGKEDFNCYAMKPGMYEWMNNHGDNYVAISQAIKNSWVQKGIDEKKIRVIYHGIPVNKFQINEHIFQSFPLKIIFMAAIREYKGQHQIIEAINLLSKENREKILLDIYGNSNTDYGEYLKKLISKYNLKKYISLKGFSHDKSILSQYDIGMNCSKNEGLGRFTLEYMASGLLVIASNKGANVEIINKNNGIIYDYENTQSLKDAIEKAILHFDKNHSLAECSLKDVNRKFDINKNYAYFIKLYKSLF